MSILQFLKNQHLDYYGKILFIFLFCAIIIWIFLVLKLKKEIKNSAIIPAIGAFIITLIIVYASCAVYNDYVENHVKKPIVSLDLSDLNPLKGIEENMMEFLNVNYKKS